MIRLPHIDLGFFDLRILRSSLRLKFLDTVAKWTHYRALNSPGGGVWFGKQVFLATLGVAAAVRVRSTGGRCQNIEVANAVEALACWMALEGNGWTTRRAPTRRNEDVRQKGLVFRCGT